MAINYHKLAQQGPAGTTGTGLDRLTDVLKFDRHLISQLSLEDRNAAASASVPEEAAAPVAFQMIMF